MLRWTAVDRLLALALQIYEGRIDPAHGQRRDLALDPDLADQWAGLDPIKDHAAEALSLLSDTKKDPHLWRYAIGLKEGWEDVKAQRVRARIEAATSEG